MESSRSPLIGILLACTTLLIVMCLCCSIGLAAYLVTWRADAREVKVQPEELANLATEPSTEPLPSLEPGQPTFQPALPTQNRPTSAVPLTPSLETVQILADTQVPDSDPIDLAMRLLGLTDIPRTLNPPLIQPQVGARESFWATDTDSHENFEVTATLRYITDHLYFWVEDGVSYRGRDLRKLAETFETEIYPAERAFFGSEWSPGVDGDPRLHILYAEGLGFSVAGYYSSADEFPIQVNEYSNAKEMFFINADNVDLGDKNTLGILAHEFQHMINWNVDRNEDTWMNEGFSEVAAYLTGYESGSAVPYYLDDPDIPLTTWPDEPDSAHYGAAFHFLAYFLNRFGEQITQALVAHPTNGLESIDQTLAEAGIKDLQTNKPLNADQVFADWAVSNYTQDVDIPGLDYEYPVTTEAVPGCPAEPETRQVHQYGVDYLSIQCQGPFTLRLNGSPAVKLVAGDPHSGKHAFWSNMGAESDMTLTREFDFSDHAGPLTLDFWTWFDIEEDYDHAYVLSSIDDGQTWQILTTPSGTAEDPTGNSFGWAYSGASGGQNRRPEWVREQVDISSLAGKKALLRFEYVTDGAVIWDGLLVDDVAIPEIGYATDFEDGDDGWQAAGFALVENVLPQTFRVSVIEEGDNPSITQYTLDGDNLLELPFEIGRGTDAIILVVSGTTRVTQQTANYDLQIIK